MTESKKTNSPPRIMIVVDESDILSVIKRGLESKNDFMVDTFSKADDAIENFQNRPPNYYDLVITDIRMPKVNGFELYRRIKDTNPHMKIAFITAFEINKEEFSKVIPSVNVTHFISKPVSISKLREKIKSILDDNDTEA
ncbi:MAG: response regulator [Nitrososphaeraceae archaeon]|nr:response regulator [Nitrososphaeraceae archaeon]